MVQTRCVTAMAGLILLVALPLQARELAPGQSFRDCDHCPEMVVVPAGSVPVGDPLDYEDAEDGPRPGITIARPFAIGKYEVTQAQWQAVMGNNPSHFKGPERPVEMVTWRDVQEYLTRLNAQTGKHYRLPSEAEWEYATRAGSGASYSFGEDKAQLGRHAWYEGNSGGETKPVGQLPPNAFGLHDMHGNVWEWSADCYGSNYAGTLPVDFAKEREGFCYRVIRGGSMLNFPKYLTAFYRTSLTPVNFNNNLGFRVVLTLP